MDFFNIELWKRIELIKELSEFAIFYHRIILHNFETTQIDP